MKILRLILVSTVLGLLATPSYAKVLASPGDWLAFDDQVNDNLACGMSSEPKKSAGKYSKRGLIYAVISHRPSESRFNEFSFQAGYTFGEGVDVGILIDEKTSFTLFTKGGHAWAKDTETDKALIAAMRAGGTMVITGVSSRGTKTTDTFSLRGFSAALKIINAACNVK